MTSTTEKTPPAETGERGYTIADVSIMAVRDRVPLVDLIQLTMRLEDTGNGVFKGACPFHDDGGQPFATFAVSASRNVYFCSACGAGGDAIRYVMERTDATFIEAIERLAAIAGIELHYIRRPRINRAAAGSPCPGCGETRHIEQDDEHGRVIICLNPLCEYDK